LLAGLVSQSALAAEDVALDVDDVHDQADDLAGVLEGQVANRRRFGRPTTATTAAPGAHEKKEPAADQAVGRPATLLAG